MKKLVRKIKSNKKILIVCIAAILLASITAASANTQKVDDHESYGVYYKVPDGFTLQNKISAMNSDSYIFEGDGIRYYYKSLFGTIEVYIYDLVNSSITIDGMYHRLENEVYETALTNNTTHKTIGDKYGVFDEQYEHNHKVFVFCYVENGKFIYIKTANMTFIEEMLS